MGSSSKSKSLSNGSGAPSQKRSKSDSGSDKPAKKPRSSEATDAQAAEAKKKAKAARDAEAKKKAKAAKEAEKSDSDEEDSDEEGSGEEEDGEFEPDPQDNEDGVDDDIETEGKTEEEIDAERKKLAKSKAKKRGYRIVAKKAGYSAQYDSGYSHLDVAVPVLSESEVIRAAKWAPKMANKAAYDGLTEFEERHRLSLKSLPPSAARVIRAHAEPYLRRLVNGAFQRASDQQKTGVKIAQVVAETRPLQRVQKYSFVAPKGLIRYSQDTAELERLKRSPEDKTEDTLREEKALLKEQKAMVSKLKKEKEKEDAEKAALRAEKTAAAAAATSAA
jgi:hypothetical protein